MSRYGPLEIKIKEQNKRLNKNYKNFYTKRKDGYINMKIWSERFHKVFNVIIDKSSISKIDGIKWYIDRRHENQDKSKNKKQVYVVRGVIRFPDGKLKNVFLHRYLLDLQFSDPKIQVDHINRNTLDNTMKNLRIVTNKENANNRSIQYNNKTGVSDISFNDKINSYISRFYDENGKRITQTFSVNKYGMEEAFRLAKYYQENKLIRKDRWNKKL